MDIWYYVLSPFTWLLQFFYDFLGSYGLALILFAVVVKLILFPFSLKGKRSMIQMNMLSGKMQQIQKKYANDKERQNLEIQKLYEKEKVNPMGGCLWSFLPLLILFPLYAIIRQPLKYMMGLDPNQILNVANAVNWDAVAVSMNWTTADAITKAVEAATTSGGIISGFVNSGYNQLFLASLIKPETLTAVQNVLGEGTKVFAMNFNFFGIDLSQVPNWKLWEIDIEWKSIGLFLVPVVSAVTGLLFSVISMKTNQMNSQGSDQQNSTNKMMMLMSPIMSLWIGFIMPAGLGIYWIANNVLSLIQEFVAGKMLKKDYEAAAAAREEQLRLEKEEEKKKKRQAAEKKAQAIAEGKLKKGKKGQQEKKKGDQGVIAVSGVGVRAYARGRAYDPYRYSQDGPTAYKDPGEPIDETAVEKALKKKSDHLEEVALEAAADDMIMDEIAEAEGLRDSEAADEAETPDVEAETAGDPWEEIDQEVAEIQAEAEDDETPKE